MKQLWKLALAPALVAGCTATPDRKSTVDQDLTSPNGTSLNGTSLNGKSLNGTSLNGISVNGVSLNGTSLNGTSLNGISVNGTSLNGVSLNGTSLNGTSLNGTSLNGIDFIGAQLQAALSNGTVLDLRIDDIAPLRSDPELLTYQVTASVDGGWVPLCGLDTDGSQLTAIPVGGWWNATTGAWHDDGVFSFACRKASIAKCVELGYKSWEGYTDQHHACVRMLRADYCGDGTPHTVNGTPINLYDNVGVQADTEAWPVDAEWTADGAMCINHNRGGARPSCYNRLYSPTCGTFANGAVLIDEYNGR